jgi:predicted nicotinamide N-methyase
VTPSAERILSWTELVAPPLVPELRLHLVTERCALWRADAAELRRLGLPEPYWAFCWGGGQALARVVLGRPELVRGRSVLDLGAGSGLVALAAARAGAARVCAADVDPWAECATLLNATANGLRVETTTEDLLARPADRWDVLLAGDMGYEPLLAARLVAWLAAAARDGALALLGDLGRGFLATDGLAPLGTMPAPTDVATCSHHRRPATVWRVLAAPSPAAAAEKGSIAAPEVPL